MLLARLWQKLISTGRALNTFLATKHLVKSKEEIWSRNFVFPHVKSRVLMAPSVPCGGADMSAVIKADLFSFF